MTFETWSSKSHRKEYNLNRLQFVSEENLLKRQKIIAEQLNQKENQLNAHKHLEDMDPSLNLHRLSTIIPAFVRKGQHNLSADFERKKLIFLYDVNDYRFVQSFYNLKPSEDQVRFI